MSKSRIFRLFCFLVFVAVAATGGWVAGSRIESPAEAAARTAPPTPSPILVPVEERVLSSNVVTRGTARFGLPQPISIGPSALKANAGLITTLPLPNSQLNEGSVMLTASGRPVFVLQGDIPAYRDLVPGISGQDVRQLEQGLERLGFDPGPIDGIYDEQTGAAVQRWYKGAGWEPFGPTIEQLARIRTLEQGVGDAQRNKLLAVGTASAAGRGVESARASAAHADQAAAAEVAAKIAAQEKVSADLANAARAVESARATANHAIRVAAGEVEARIADQKRLAMVSGKDTPLAVESARARAELANQSASAEIAAKIWERALIVVDPQQTRTARAAADAKLELARAAALNTKLESEAAVQAAIRDAKLAAGQLELANAAYEAAKLAGEVTIKTALDAQNGAQREANIVQTQIEVARAAARATQLDGEKVIQAALDAHQVAELDAKLAAEQADRVAADLDVAQRKVGVQIPVDEIVFIPAMPVRVHQVSALVGEPASGPVMSVTDNQLAIDSQLRLDEAPLVKPGMTVAIDEQSLGIEAKGIVKTIATTPGTRGVDAYHIYCEVHVDETPIPLEGFSLRLTIPIKSTSGVVTAVPLSALSLSADGTSRIQLENDGALDYIVVEPGLSADGYVEVTPVDRTLEAGQFVVVGYENNESADLQVSDLPTANEMQ